ncbi:MAG: hypothetical protein ACFFBH_09590 [Promethearchaeota archaeon]
MVLIRGNADPVAVNLPEDPFMRSICLIIFFLIGTSIEYGIFQLIMTNNQWNRKVLLSCFKVNLVTFPLTQILAYIISRYLYSFFWFYILGVEILVIFIEWFLFKIELNKIFINSIKGNDILFISTSIANASSFFVGLLAIFIPLFPLSIYSFF